MRFRSLVIVVACAAASELRAQDVVSQSTNTWIANGTVHSTVTAGETTYLAGNFSRIGKRTGPLTALDSITGQPTAAPRITDGDVVDLEPDGSGGYFLAGQFTQIDGHTRSGLARVTSGGVVDGVFVPSGFDFASSVVLVGTRLFAAVHRQPPGTTLITTLHQLDRLSGSVIGSPSGTPGDVASPSLRLYAGPNNLLILHGNGIVVALDATTGAQVWRSAASLLTLAGNVAYIARGTEILRLDLITGNATTLVPSATCPVTQFCGTTGRVVFAGRLFVTRVTTIRTVQIVGTEAYDPDSGANLNWGVNLNRVTGLPSGLGAGVGPTANQLTVLGDRLVLQVPSKLIAVDPVSAAPTGWVAYLIGGTMLDSFVDASHFIVAGNFRGAGGVPRAGLAAVSWPDGAPTTWAPDPPIPMSRAVFGPLALVGPRLFVYDSTWLRELDPISGNTISVTSLAGVIAISGVGTRLYVAGAFNAINGLTRRGIASFDISGPVPVLESWAPVLTFPPVSNPAGVTNILATDRVVLVSGGFTDVNGVPRNGLAAIDAVTAAVLPWAPPFRDVGFDLSADRLWISGFEPSSTATGGQAAFNFSGEQLPWQAAPSPLPLQLGEARTQQHAVVFGNRLYVGRGYAIEQSTGAVVNWTPSFEGQPTFSVFSSRWSAAPGRGVVLHRHAGGFDLFPRVDLPARPIDVTASATAGSAALAWGPVVGAVSYVIEVGTSAGASNLGTIETTGPVTSFATAAPTGTYFVRLRARTTSGLSGASAEQRIVIGANACGAAPNPPHSMTAEIASARATLRWFAPVGGPVPTRYIVEVRDGLGANLITSIDAGPNLSLTGPVSTGSYYWVRVRAASACGLSDPTDDVLIAS